MKANYENYVYHNIMGKQRYGDMNELIKGLRLMGYAGSYKGLTFLGLALSAVAMILGMAPYLCVWLVVRDLIAATPNWTRATSISRYDDDDDRQERRPDGGVPGGALDKGGAKQ